MNIFSFLRPTQTALFIHRNLNCWTAAITKKHRKVYLNTYPVHLVLPDGSSINIDYHEPRRIITLPIDITILSEEQRQLRLQRRKSIQKVKIVDEYQDDFDETQFY
ncbi:PREDICTED: 39S ribosomal protein L55, mitochondrial [Eufriesea mexicana]|uniref:39S ribosomal protein L55, mitochondrial n=1 Tax=Eufriesea mexicana TaxID=516756 RepID=UPI00083C4AF7|nr:PREDICTED: 39S ribosomal protein L55, mitochondrial [Eufriesea mexicana]